MTTPKKKHLIELMIEAGVKWPDGAEYAAQDNEVMHKVCFYKTKPVKDVGMTSWSFRGYVKHSAVPLPSLCRKWHQTIVTREQYEKALAESHSVHFPTRPPETFMCRCVAAPVASTIEQLTADYHAKAAEADRTQAVADDALKAADDALLALEKAGELIGLVISIDTKPKQEAQPEITDWRDLRVGDVIECVEPWGGMISAGDSGVITSIGNDTLLADFDKQMGYCYKLEHIVTKFRLIRRP